MEMLKIEELKKELNVGDYGEQFCDYDCGYIENDLQQIANNNSEIFPESLIDWFKDNYNIVNDYIEEMGEIKDNQGNCDIIETIKAAQIDDISNDLFLNIKDILKFWALNYIQNTLKKDEITSNQWDEIESHIDATKSDKDLQDFTDEINKILK